MRKIFLFLLLLPFFGKAQPTRPEARVPFRHSVACVGGIPFLMNEKETGTHTKLFQLLPNYVTELSLNVYQGVGLTGGLRGGNFLTPRIPEGYEDFNLLYNTNDKTYDAFQAAYAVLTYDWYVPLSRPPAFPAGILLQPGLGIAQNRVNEAYFTDYTGKGSFASFIGEPTHDVTWKETVVTGLAAQFSLCAYARFSPKTALYAGPAFWTLPGPGKRYYGMEGRMGAVFSLFASRRPSVAR